MLWVFLLAVSSDTYAVAGIYPSKELCEEQLEVEFDKCWPAKLVLDVPEDENIFIVKPSYDY